MSKKIQVLLLTSSMLVIAFVMIGSLGVHASGPNSGDVTLKHIGVYSEVLYRVRAEYVEEPNMSVVTNGALHGLLESLDADSSYLSPSEYKVFKQKKTEGKAGLGATVSKRFGYAAIVSVIPGGPADKAGLNAGDIIETVEGQSTHDLSLAAIKNHLTGDPGSRLDMTIIRTRKIEPQKITVVRDVVALPAVQESTQGEVGIIKAQVLTKGKAQEIADRIKSLQKKGVKKLVLDLRYNSEGEQEEGVAAANLFLGKGTIASLSGQKYDKVTYTADPQKKITDLPVVVLVNRGTAGPAELVASAIQDNQRGEVLGDKTFGEGSIQKLIEVPDGSALILSVAKYYTPNGKVIQDTGITPNVLVASTDDIITVTDDDDNTTTEEAPKATQPKDDEQMRRAIELLKNKQQKS
ncbi:MAG TPA: S41 family peptidase [Candidatus Angelobacter sp.]|nr:S41 family peptidase [Candidatus Angelobacter sp.]